jgi:hypothetical protein
MKNPTSQWLLEEVTCTPLQLGPTPIRVDRASVGTNNDENSSKRNNASRFNQEKTRIATSSHKDLLHQ